MRISIYHNISNENRVSAVLYTCRKMGGFEIVLVDATLP